MSCCGWMGVVVARGPTVQAARTVIRHAHQRQLRYVPRYRTTCTFGIAVIVVTVVQVRYIPPCNVPWIDSPVFIIIHNTTTKRNESRKVSKCKGEN